MALFNKFGSILRQNLSKSAQVPQMLNAIRSMSSMKLFIGGLDYGTDDTSLRVAFSSYGKVVEAKVITDRDTGRSRGFGYVSFSDTESATAALNALDGKPLNGRNVRVGYAEDKPPRGGGYGYGVGGGGGYGGGGGGYGGDGY